MKTDEQGLLKQIKSKSFDRVYLIYGSEDYLKQYYSGLIPKKTVEPDFEAFNLHNLDGKSTTLDEIADCVSALPMMGEYSCTVVHDMNLSELIKGKASDEDTDESDNSRDSGRFEELTEIISDVPESSILIFWMDAIQVDDKNSKWIKIIKTFEKYGTSAKLEKRTMSALARLLSDSASKKECTLDIYDANYMITLIGDDMGTLKNELDKLCLYKKSGKITRSDIDACVTPSAQAKIFSLAKSIIAGRADEAFSTLSLLIKQKEEPVKILIVLSGTYVDMYRVKAATQSGMKYGEVATIFKGYKSKMFVLENAASSAKKYSIEQLREAIALLSEADTLLKSSRTDGQTILETLIVKLLRI